MRVKGKIPFTVPRQSFVFTELKLLPNREKSETEILNKFQGLISLEFFINYDSNAVFISCRASLSTNLKVDANKNNHIRISTSIVFHPYKCI